MRLQEIKGLNYSDTRFGNVTIIAVGHLYQLPPLKDKKIYDTYRAATMIQIQYPYMVHFGKRISTSMN